jgi:LmbE family N-acetylglucosaminyl deacetylase
MSKEVLVVAPHPDDETLGCGGTLLKHVQRGDKIHWLIFTAISEDNGYSRAQIDKRNCEITAVAQAYGFSSVQQLQLPTTRLDTLPLGDMIAQASQIMNQIRPEILYLPFPGDVHSDHRIVFEVMMACTKQFRYPWVRRVLAYETLSETDFGINPIIDHFRSNVFIDISEFLERKIEIMNIYQGEFKEFPFPRSEQAVRALAQVRGAAANCRACESFVLLKEID